MLRRFTIALLMLVAASGATARQTTQTAGQELGRVETEQQAREAQQQVTLAEVERTRREIAELTAELAELNAAQARGETDVGAKRLRLAALNARDEALAARADANENQLAHLLSALQLFSRNPPPALLVHPGDARSAVRAAILLRAVTPSLEQRARTFAAEARLASRARRDAAAGAEDLFASESSLAERAAQIETVLAAKTALEQGLTGEAVIAARRIEALALRAQALRAVVGRLPSIAARPAPVTALGPGSLAAPVKAPPVRKFGDAEPGGGRSEGWSWHVSPGADVPAPAGGLVDYAGPVEGWGQVVIVNVGGGDHLVMAGLATPMVAAGQSVARGQTLGKMADRANIAPGSSMELHMEVRRAGKAVDPAIFLTGR